MALPPISRSILYMCLSLIPARLWPLFVSVAYYNEKQALEQLYFRGRQAGPFVTGAKFRLFMGMGIIIADDQRQARKPNAHMLQHAPESGVGDDRDQGAVIEPPRISRNPAMRCHSPQGRRTI